MRPLPIAGLAGFAASALIAAAAQAQQAAAPAAPAPPASWFETIKLSGHIEAGVSGNPDSPANNINFGQLFTDRDNALRMNQAMLTAERDLDPKATGWDFGFKLQGMYGTDARITHFFNEFDRVTKSPYQWDIVEANALVHMPLLTAGGIDLKLGQYSTPMGYEVIDATGNPLYSHSYIYNFGLPLKHTGVLATAHITDWLDIWAGLDTGVNDSLGEKGINNGVFPKGLGGFGLNNLFGGKLTILALAHIGPENPRGLTSIYGTPVDASEALREIFDVVISYKITDQLTATTELNRIHDDYFKATGGGVAQYLTYQINDQWSITGRAEVFADQSGSDGFAGFVGQPTGPLDFVDGERGLLPNASYFANLNSGKPFNATYGELTIGATWKPPLPLGRVNLSLRPELRYDQVIGGSNIKPFDVNAQGVGTKSGSFTLAMDAILAF